MQWFGRCGPALAGVSVNPKPHVLINISRNYPGSFALQIAVATLLRIPNDMTAQSPPAESEADRKVLTLDVFTVTAEREHGISEMRRW